MHAGRARFKRPLHIGIGVNTMLTAEQQQAYDALYLYAQHQMTAGVSDEQIQREMVQQGWDAETARTITTNLRAQPQPTRPINYYTPASYSPQPRPKARSGGGGGGDMALGAIICIIGLVVTIGSYAAASGSSGGGSYVIAWGAIVFGAIRFFKGLSESGGAR
jgi:hypothetical protein